MKDPLYPLRFQPVYERNEWAGSLLRGYLSADPDRDLPPEGTGVSWELVDDDSMMSVVANGPLAGTPLAELLQRHPKTIAGNRHLAGERFPLCVRVLDVGERLPLLVQPSTPVSGDGFESRPSNKFWFSLATAGNADIIVGIGAWVTRLQVMQRVNSAELEPLLQVYSANPGDAFFVPNQRVHSIGSGNLVWEVQERVAPPLRVSDWRADEPVPAPEQEEALGCIYFQDRQVGRISREAAKVTRTRKVPLLHFCPKFVVDEIRLCDHVFDRTNGSSFHLFGMAQGSGEIHSDAGVEQMPQGSVTCVPAALGDYRIYVHGETASLLRVMLQGAR